MPSVSVTGIGAKMPSPGEAGSSLEFLIYESASAALADAGLERDDLDGIVISASDQVDGRAISSMLTSGPAGAYLNEEINIASSPAHAVAMAYMQILSGTQRRVLVSSWGKASETRGGSTQAAERLSVEPFCERDAGLTALAATALQAGAHRLNAPDREAVQAAAAAVTARNRADGTTAEEVLASPMVAWPLRALERPEETDACFSLLLEPGDRAGDDGITLDGIGWSTDSGRVAERDLVALAHLQRAAQDAYRRAGVTDPATEVGDWRLHDYSPDAELLAYAPMGLCAREESLELGLRAALPINRGGGSLRGEAPFGGPLRKAVDAVRALREGQIQRAVAQISGGFAGQFQSVIVIGRHA
jgi:acetyl-CoA C-acetyltransferase